MRVGLLVLVESRLLLQLDSDFDVGFAFEMVCWHVPQALSVASLNHFGRWTLRGCKNHQYRLEG